MSKWAPAVLAKRSFDRAVRLSPLTRTCTRAWTLRCVVIAWSCGCAVAATLMVDRRVRCITHPNLMQRCYSLQQEIRGIQRQCENTTVKIRWLRFQLLAAPRHRTRTREWRPSQGRSPECAIHIDCLARSCARHNKVRGYGVAPVRLRPSDLRFVETLTF